MIHIIVWVLVLFSSILLFRKASGSLSPLQPNMISVMFYYSMLVSSFIGSIFIVLGTDKYYMTGKLTHEVYRTIGFYTICFVMLFLPLVMWLVNKLVKFDAQKEFKSYLANEITIFSYGKREFFWLFTGLSLLSLAGIAYTILKTPYVPIFDLFLNRSDMSAGQLRIEASRNFAGNVLIKNIFAIALTPLLSLIAYGYAVKTRDPNWKLLFIMLFCGSVFINIYDLSKAPIFFYLIMFLLLRLYVGKMRFTYGKLVRWGLLGGTVLIVMYIVVQGVNDAGTFLSYNKGPIGRLIFAQITPTYLHLDYFTESIPFLNGRSFPASIVEMFGGSHIRSGRLLMTTVFPEKISEGTGGVLNTLFIGEAFANFGYIGVVIGTLYVGLLVQTIYIIFLRLPKHPVFLALFVYFSINIPRTIVGGFTDFLYNPIWIFVVIIFGGMILFLRMKKDAVELFLRKKGRGVNER